MQGIWDPAVASGRDGESPPPPPDPENEPPRDEVPWERIEVERIRH